jgi:type IV pilus assembly protein PilB
MAAEPPERLLEELERLLPPDAPGEPILESRAESLSRTVLVVDDNADYRLAVAFLMREAGLRVLEAADGAEGLRMAIAEVPDLIFLDYHLPHLNGYELFQELQQRWETRKIPVILSSGARNREHLKELGLGVTDFLFKPVPNEQLLEAAGRALGLRLEAKSVPEAGPGAALPAESLQIERYVPGVPGDLEEDISAVPEPSSAVEEKGLEEAAQDTTLVSQLNRILIKAVEMRASDIHLEPLEDALQVRVRVDGSLVKLCSLPSATAARLSVRVKILSNLVITERRLPQDGQFRASIRGQKIEFRVSVLPSAYGEKIVIRVLGQSKLKSALSELDLNARDLESCERALRTPHGLILVTGPTGSGKTTTLYTMLASLNKPDVNIVTAEDPVEYRMAGICQVQVQASLGLTFEAALRSFLRQDPDIMLVGEIRDKETAEIAVKASITGHLVLSTLHTNGAPATITRLTHMGLAPFLVAASVKLVVAQRLLKLLCAACKRPAPLGDEERRFLTEEESRALGQTCRPVGCPACSQTGYSGRRAVFEVMPVAGAKMRGLILRSADADALGALAAEEGMVSLRRAALEAAARQETSLEEALKIAMAD